MTQTPQEPESKHTPEPMPFYGHDRYLPEPPDRRTGRGVGFWLAVGSSGLGLLLVLLTQFVPAIANAWAFLGTFLFVLGAVLLVRRMPGSQ